MRRYLLWIQIINQVLVALSEKLPSPQDVHVDSLLQWKPRTADINVRYTVQYQIYDDSLWRNVPGCFQTKHTSCNISNVSKVDDKCVMLRVRAEVEGSVSRPVNACSIKQDDSCSPAVKLTSYPGFLLVHIQNNSLYEQYSGHAGAKVSYAREGAQLKELKKYLDIGVPLPINDLQQGMRYCVQVHHELYKKLYGLPSCTLCEDIPISVAKTNEKTIVAIIVPMMIFLGLILVTAYLFFFQCGKIKHLMKPPLQVPPHYSEFFSRDFSEQPQALTTHGNMESFDHVSIVSTDE